MRTLPYAVLGILLVPLALQSAHAEKFETQGVAEIKSKGILSITTEEKNIAIPSLIDTDDPRWSEVVPNRNVQPNGWTYCSIRLKPKLGLLGGEERWFGFKCRRLK